MANQSVLELAVGTGKWDAGLKKAKQSLDNFTQANGGLQQALDKESQKMSQFVQMMGKMDSTAKTAKGQMNDYKSTIEQLTMQYNRMTDAQKQSIGQDYLNAIDQMKQKYQAVNEEIQEMNRSLNQTTTPDANSGGDGLFGGGKLGGMLQVFGGNLMTKAADAAMSFAGGIAECAKQGIELAKQGEGVYLAFQRLLKGNGEYLKTAPFGGIQEIPEQHLANRVAAYGATSKRQFMLEVRQNAISQITPINKVSFESTSCQPVSIGHDWRDDVVQLKMIEL